MVTLVPSRLRCSVAEMKPVARLTVPSVARVSSSTSRSWFCASTVKTLMSTMPPVWSEIPFILIRLVPFRSRATSLRPDPLAHDRAPERRDLVKQEQAEPARRLHGQETVEEGAVERIDGGGATD